MKVIQLHMKRKHHTRTFQNRFIRLTFTALCFLSILTISLATPVSISNLQLELNNEQVEKIKFLAEDGESYTEAGISSDHTTCTVTAWFPLSGTNSGVVLQNVYALSKDNGNPVVSPGPKRLCVKNGGGDILPTNRIFTIDLSLLDIPSAFATNVSPTQVEVQTTISTLNYYIQGTTDPPPTIVADFSVVTPSAGVAVIPIDSLSSDTYTLWTGAFTPHRVTLSEFTVDAPTEYFNFSWNVDVPRITYVATATKTVTLRITNPSVGACSAVVGGVDVDCSGGVTTDHTLGYLTTLSTRSVTLNTIAPPIEAYVLSAPVVADADALLVGAPVSIVVANSSAVENTLVYSDRNNDELDIIEQDIRVQAVSEDTFDLPFFFLSLPDDGGFEIQINGVTQDISSIQGELFNNGYYEKASDAEVILEVDDVIAPSGSLIRAPDSQIVPSVPESVIKAKQITPSSTVYVKQQCISSIPDTSCILESTAPLVTTQSSIVPICSNDTCTWEVSDSQDAPELIATVVNEFSVPQDSSQVDVVSSVSQVETFANSTHHKSKVEFHSASYLMKATAVQKSEKISYSLHIQLPSARSMEDSESIYFSNIAFYDEDGAEVDSAYISVEPFTMDSDYAEVPLIIGDSIRDITTTLRVRYMTAIATTTSVRYSSDKYSPNPKMQNDLVFFPIVVTGPTDGGDGDSGDDNGGDDDEKTPDTTQNTLSTEQMIQGAAALLCVILLISICLTCRSRNKHLKKEAKSQKVSPVVRRAPNADVYECKIDIVTFGDSNSNPRLPPTISRSPSPVMVRCGSFDGSGSMPHMQMSPRSQSPRDNRSYMRKSARLQTLKSRHSRSGSPIPNQIRISGNNPGSPRSRSPFENPNRRNISANQMMIREIVSDLEASSSYL